MTTNIHNNRDALAGLLFMALGAIGFVVALSYPFGSLQEMGPGFFPRVLGVMLVGFGIATLIKGLRSGERVDGAWSWLPLLLLAASLIAFGWLMEHFGLLPALVVLIVTSARAGREFRWKEAAVLTVVLCVMAVAIFVWGLGLPYDLFSFEPGH
ncbi:MAG: tripartite tricarboxylate transporter TctB family protein [Hydrogenophaga sp.]|nr:tripartite tricarboxylate transporter TctB family protein [Hydrogenophaga sp.]